MQSERATGTLALDHDGESASLYFLFGHLFHASGAGGQGEDVVIRALGWDDGQYQFDPRAKLPAEETIKSSPAELLSAAQSRQGGLTEPEPAPTPTPVMQSQQPQRQPFTQPAPSRQPLGARQEQSPDIMYPLPSG